MARRTDVPRSPLEDHVVRILRDAKRNGFTDEQLARSTGAEAGDLSTALASLEDEGAIVRLPRQRWAETGRSGMLTGRVRVERSGRGLVLLDIPDAPLALERHALRPAMDGDRVLVEPRRDRRGGLHQARIVRILERRRKRIVGVASPIARKQLLPIDDRIGPYVIVLSDDSDPAPQGMAVAAEILEYPSGHRDLVVRVESVLGKVGELGTEIRSVCLLHGIEEEFTPEVLEEAGAFGEPGPTELEGRTDLRQTLTMTVDPADAKDHDDAMAIEETGQGWRVTVSIADVSWYVRPGTLLDAEAYERSTSVYFPGRCVPMLPEKLSADLASLHPGVDRLAVSVFLDIDRSGQVRGTSFARSVIHSLTSLTYEQVQAVLDGGDFRPSSTPKDDDAETLRDDAPGETATTLAPEVEAALVAMARCADALHRRRLGRGAIDMDLPESTVVLSETGEVETIARRPRRFAHRLVEEFMLAANEAVAERIDRAGAAFLYRIHERPDDEALAQLATRVRALGLRLQREGGLVSPKVFQALLEDAQGRAEARQVNMMVLRTMTRARYSAAKEMHFGLASRCYTHFTSPIRRYPDLVAHRALLALLAREAGGKPDALPDAEALHPVAEHTSSRERRAMDAERDIASAAAVLYMARHVGERLEGTVSGVDRWGFWVELDVASVEGFVHIGRLSEYYDYVVERMELQSRVSSAVVHIGQRTTVRVVSVDLASRRIELEPA